MEEHPLDQYEFLGALQHRDEVEMWLQINGDGAATDDVDAIDARLQAVTDEDSRFAAHFAAPAGTAWWWRRFPSDPAAQDYIQRTGGRAATPDWVCWTCAAAPGRFGLPAG